MSRLVYRSLRILGAQDPVMTGFQHVFAQCSRGSPRDVHGTASMRARIFAVSLINAVVLRIAPFSLRLNVRELFLRIEASVFATLARYPHISNSEVYSYIILSATFLVGPKLGSSARLLLHLPKTFAHCLGVEQQSERTCCTNSTCTSVFDALAAENLSRVVR